MMDGSAQVGLAVDGAVRRKRFSVEQKQQIIRAAFELGASVAREYGLKANQVFKWMKLREGGLLIDRPRQNPGLLPVRIAEETALEHTPVRLLLQYDLDRFTLRSQARQCLLSRAGE